MPDAVGGKVPEVLKKRTRGTKGKHIISSPGKRKN